jgi:molybdopterin/thiamine biosynthesis adenylyltransferase
VLAKPDYLRFKFVTFAIKTPIGWLGFGFNLVDIEREVYKNKPKTYRNYLHNKGGEQLLFRLSIQEIGSQFVHSRNLTFQDLKNKRIAVVGCGAIGSFVAQSLIRLGAGTGSLGLLKLIDPEILNAENIGRHVLGYPSLMRKKSTALAEELLRLFPHSKVEAIASSVADHNALFAAELIIDATGEESVSELLNGVRIQRSSRVPILYVWVRGNGEAVQALWTDSNGYGCYRCLLLPDATHHRKERFRLLKSEPVRRMIGCHAATPYAVSAPMHAAALATDMVCGWIQGNPSPRFRTRSVETANHFVVKNQDISKMNGCPACDHI